jgi:hypothetical protein
MQNTAFRLACLSMLFLAPMAGKAQTPGVLVLNAKRLVKIKAGWKQDKETEQLVKALQKQADRLLLLAPVSVMDKAATPESGTRHDYMSQAPYFWYDSSKPNGRPYMRKDGQHNPETYKIADHKNLADLGTNSELLALAWYITGDEKYAKKATTLLRYWFFDEATKMNPNLDYAQAIPGVNNGRGIGIIESIPLIMVADAAGLLKGAKSWTPKDEKALKSWYASYLDWMLTSRNGQDEHAAKNNHGTWYHVQAVDFALFTGNKAKAQQLAKESRDILDNQIAKEGTMPLELERTNSLAYSTYNLQGWFWLAALAEKTGIDLWHYRNKQDATLRTAFDWLKPYALGEKPWTYQQISDYKKTVFYGLLLEAGNKYTEPAYLAGAKQISPQINDKIADLLYGR